MPMPKYIREHIFSLSPLSLACIHQNRIGSTYRTRAVEGGCGYTTRRKNEVAQGWKLNIHSIYHAFQFRDTG